MSVKPLIRLYPLLLCAALLLVFATAGADHRSQSGMVVAAHPLATDAGVEILEAGGTAIDAAIAIQAVLTLVEPQSSGIGGGAFLLHYDGATTDVQAYDGRETAPAAIESDHFLTETGAPMDFLDAVPGGQSVGVPGTLRMLELAHAEHGELPWGSLFQPAIRLAEAGFEVTPRLAGMLRIDLPLAAFEPMAGYFFPDGAPVSAGMTLTNPALAETLAAIADRGADVFYEGAIADAIVTTVQAHGGKLTRQDMADYRAVERPPVCRSVTGHSVCGMPLPSSGGMTVLQILRLLEIAGAENNDSIRLAWAHLLLEASRLGFADRNEYLGDTDFVEVPVETLLSERYLTERAGLISPTQSMGKARPGLNDPDTAMSGAKPINHSTSHFSVLDAAGNAVSMTSSVEMPFGSRLMVGGFVLNNQLTDFRFDPAAADGRPHPNRVQPGKRPLSSMSPMIALDRDDQPRLIIGSPGGTRIIGYVAQRVADVLMRGGEIKPAIETGNLVNRNGATQVEAGTEAQALAPDLEALGHEVEVETMTSGLHGIERLPDGVIRGAADPRREGTVGRPGPP
ncbi:gamma-glutamyltransferase [Spiribacter aquaticus]|uniref:Glutathione hydrolase proenzyme n=1 Tax=Spiribacter aquaticus TaxID=1935996 RepID=A0A557RJL7_9GAMM|nr:MULTISPECIES: gamma-glutamyltransferase [Spiribacter]KAF0280112.1 gamma-glutamyltransferase [Spiribacter roseus]TVO65359.1 gamma-glutamyltransferase [Spiribacter aquaticus]